MNPFFRSKSHIFLSGLLAGLFLPAAADAQLLYVASSNDNAIYKVSSTGVSSSFVTGLNKPLGLAFDKNGNLFEADFGSNTIFKITPGGVKSVFASGLNGPVGLVFDSFGNLYESDYFSNKILKFTPGGASSLFVDALSGPQGLAFDSQGNLYEADSNGVSINVFAPDKSQTSIGANLMNADVIALDGNDRLYVGESAQLRIDTFDPVTHVRAIYPAGIGFASGLVVDSSGNLFVSQSRLGNIYEFSGPPDAPVKTVYASGLRQPGYLAFGPDTAPAAVPEPHTLFALGGPLGATVAGLWLQRRRRKIVR